MEEESNTNSRERILSSVLYSDNVNAEEILEQANYLGINLSGKHRIIVMNIQDSKDSPINAGQRMKAI